MGRVKIQMRKIVDRQQRNVAFAKRKSGFLKKAYELFILCDVQMVLIFFSPSGKLFLFDTKTRYCFLVKILVKSHLFSCNSYS